VRKLIYVVAGLVALLIAAVVIAVLVVDLNQYKGEIEAELESATGRDVTLGGNIHVTFWPSIGAAVDDVAIANAPGGSPDPMLRARTLQVVVAISPLLSGNVQVESIRIVEPVLLVETLPDGGSNLTLGAIEDEGATAEPSQPSAPSTPVRIDRIEIVDGKVIYRDAATGEEQTVEEINLSAQARSLQGPFQADGSLKFKGVETSFAADVGGLDRATVPVSLRVGLNGDAALATFTGQLSGLDSDPRAGGNLLVQAQSLSAALAPFMAPMSEAAKPLVDQPFELDAQIVAGSTSLTLADLALSLGDIRATGDASASTEQGTSIDIALSANQLDGDLLIAAIGGQGNGTTDNGEGETASGESTDVSVDEGGTELPRDLSVSADIAVDAVTYQGNAVRQLHLIASIEDSEVVVQQLTAQLPGGTSLAIAGQLDENLDAPAFRGQVELASDNARAVLDWLKVDLSDVPAERLRRVDLFSAISVEQGVVALSDMDLGFDSSRLTGTFAADWSGVPTIIADIAVDRINLDAYLGDAEAGGGTDGSNDASAEPGEPASMFALPPMPALNADIKARVGSLTYNGVAISDALLDGQLQDGRIDLRNLAAGVADASVRAAGIIDPAAPTISVRYAIEAPNIGPLSRLLALELPVAAEDLGAVNLTGSIEGDTTTAEVVQRIESALGAASVDGTLSDPLGQPGFKGRVGLRSDSYLRLARAFGTEVSGISDSAIAFAADVDTDGNDAEFNAVLEAVGATLRASGTVAGLATSPSYDIRAKLEHQELQDLLKALGSGTGGGALGPVDLTVTAKGDDKAFSGQLVRSTIGPSVLNGTLEANLEGERPNIDLRIAADSLALDPFLAAGSGGTVGDAGSGGSGGAQASGAERWSREPLDLSALRSVDGRIQITGDKVTLQDMVFTDAVIVATIKDGTLQFEQFRGGAFEGEIRLTGSVSDGSPHHMDFDININDANAQQILEHFAETSEVRGRLFVTGKVDASGASQYDLISSLAGDASLSMKDGVIEGFDLPKISERLDNLDNEVAVVALLADATSGGETKFTEVEGTFQIADGIARSDDLRAIMEAGAAHFTMVADLPRWLIDLKGVMELTEHENSPKIRVSVTGPIDNPNRVVDTTELQNFLVQRAIETAIRKYGDGEGGSASDLLNVLTGQGLSGSQSSQEQAPPEPQAEEPAAPEAPSQEPAAEQPAAVEQQPQELNAETLLNILTGNEGGADTGAGESQVQQAPEPTAEEPAAAEQPAAEEPSAEQPAAVEQPAAEEPAAQETQPAQEAPAEPQQTQELNAETLLNILTGNQGGSNNQEQPPANEDSGQQQGEQPLNTENLLKDLLGGSGN